MSESDPRLCAPRRVLTVSADMGGGHDATAAALEQAALRLWPGADLRRLDTLAVMGPGVGPLFRRIYVANVNSTPWLYELFYSALWRHRWFAQAAKALTGSWCGRRMVSPINYFDPDVILSTYPLASSGLAWLHRHRGLRVPTAAYISDFAPHPFWVYPDLDANVVMHEAAIPLARAAEPRARVQVCAPPVVADFAPGDQRSARRTIGLEPDAFVVLVSCGAYSFGDAVATTQALLRASPEVQVVAACGRDEASLRALEQLGVPRQRLLPLGWTDQMARYMQAADVVLSNAGGATALEALASGRPVVMSQPIAAHGIANAELMALTGLAELCLDEEALVSWVRATVGDRGALDELAARVRHHGSSHDLDGGLATLVGLAGLQGVQGVPDTEVRIGPAQTSTPSRVGSNWRMRAQDAFFCHVERDCVLQELGTVLELGEVRPGHPLTLDALTRAVSVGLQGLPPLRRQMVTGGAHPSWTGVPVTLADHIAERWVDGGDEEAAREVDRFWSQSMPRDRPAWQLELIHAPDVGRTLLAVKLHHVYGDGISALGLFDRILRAAPQDPLRERRPAADWRAGRPGPATGRAVLRHAVTLGRGVVALATRGRPPAHPLNRPVAGLGRRLVTVPFPRAALRRLATAHSASAHEVALALVAEALGGVLGGVGLLLVDRPLRVMVPVAMRLPRLDRVFGNWTGSLVLDLPIGPMPLPARIAAVRAEMAQRIGLGEPPAAELVMRLAGHLPGRLHAQFARSVYTARFFNSIVSYMPAARGARWCGGAPVLATYPVLPLADGVPLTVGVIVAGDTVGMGVLLDATLPVSREDVADALRGTVARAERELP